MPALTGCVSLAEAVARILANNSEGMRLAIPLGIGKPNVLVNVIHEYARKNPSWRLDIFTALTLLKPQAAGELEQRFLEPFVARLFGNYPDLQYALDMKAGVLPANVCVHEFFLKSGEWLDNHAVQRRYICSNYTHIARDMASQQPDVLAQEIAVREENGQYRLSLSCNPDVTLDLAASMRRQREEGKPNLLIGVINRELPFMPGSAEVPSDFFDIVVDDPACSHTLFSTPNMKVGITDYTIGLHASSLVRDGGTLQIGIGSLGDAIAYSLILRDTNNAAYVAILDALCDGDLAKGREEQPFVEGLYGCSEMFVNGLLELIKAGIVRRAVKNSQTDKEGKILHGGFFIGPPAFYQSLRDMQDEKLAQIDMSSITFVNHLYGDFFADESTKRAQRTKASFINTCMMMTLSGSAVSDALEDGRVVSGVGGQYNFVAMAHELPDADSILMLRSWRMNDGKPQSNIVTHYGHCTVPRHLRDIVVTEYGIARLRGKSDEQVIMALLDIADSRFQPELADWAKQHGKLSVDYEIPPTARNNYPETIKNRLAAFHDHLPPYPFGHDFTEDELVIVGVLQKIKAAASNPLDLLKTVVAALLSDADAHENYLERMGLDEASSLKEKLLRKIFIGNL